MAESTEKVTNRALPDADDEWIPRELIEAKPSPLFRRFAPAAVSDRPGANDIDAKPARRFAPDPPPPEPAPPPPAPEPAEDPVPSIADIIAVRLGQVERVVARAASAADRSARNARRMVQDDRATG